MGHLDFLSMFLLNILFCCSLSFHRCMFVCESISGDQSCFRYVYVHADHGVNSVPDSGSTPPVFELNSFQFVIKTVPPK